MYRKMKKINKEAIDKKLEGVCNHILEFNEDATFIIAKKFKEEMNSSIGEEIKGKNIILSDIAVDEIELPSCYKFVDDGKIALWCDEEPFAKIVYNDFKFRDGMKKIGKIKRLYLDLDTSLLEELKNYK